MYIFVKFFHYALICKARIVNNSLIPNNKVKVKENKNIYLSNNMKLMIEIWLYFIIK